MITKAWHRSVVALALPIIIWISAYYILFIGYSYSWLFISAAVYIAIVLSVTIGYHRLFSHKMFICSRVWHYIFAFFGSIGLNSSPVHCSIVHIAHHKFSDTELDPYTKSWRHFFRFHDRSLSIPASIMRLARDPMHKFFMNHSFSIFILVGIITSIISTPMFIFGFILPVSLSLVANGLHSMFAHSKESASDYNKHSAKNRWFMEFLLPLGGEWNHKIHHDEASLVRWNLEPLHFDLGGYIINVLRHDTDKHIK